MSLIDLRLQLLISTAWFDMPVVKRSSDYFRPALELGDEMFLSPTHDSADSYSMLGRMHNYGVDVKLTDPAANRHKAISLARTVLKSCSRPFYQD